jgi:transcriptional regulator with XRE-family HTH domain
MTAAYKALASRVGARVFALRQQQKLRLIDVADRAGLSKAYLSQIETGKRVPSLALLLSLAEVLGVKIADLVARTDGEQ